MNRLQTQIELDLSLDFLTTFATLGRVLDIPELHVETSVKWAITFYIRGSL